MNKGRATRNYKYGSRNFVFEVEGLEIEVKYTLPLKMDPSWENLIDYRFSAKDGRKGEGEIAFGEIYSMKMMMDKISEKLGFPDNSRMKVLRYNSFSFGEH